MIRNNTEFDRVIHQVALMPDDRNACRLADLYGLAVQNVMWEDNARYKNSAWGPCISDMTLLVNNTLMPVIRHPNFQDLTWDVPIEKIPLVVGNEQGDFLYGVNLKQYLSDIQGFLHPSDVARCPASLLAARDSHVVMSAQSCFLPVPKGVESYFNVSIYNYQSYPGHPSVLAIVATANGTSAQVVDEKGQKLYFDKKGKKCSFVAERLADNRTERGVTTTGAMTQEEKQQNMILVIQVPLKNEMPPPPTNYDECLFAAAPCCDLLHSQEFEEKCARRVDVDHAIIKVGEEEGNFNGLKGLKITRDPNFPVRVTLQFYKATSNGAINDTVMQIEQARTKLGDFFGSLVVGPKSSRPTEPLMPIQVTHPHPFPIIPPAWWASFWATYRANFPGIAEDRAKELAFADRQLQAVPMSEARDTILAILASAHEQDNPKPAWDLLS